MTTRIRCLSVVIAGVLLTADSEAGWGDPLKYDQIGPVDVRKSPSWRGGDYYFLCADDFVCTETGRISEVRLRGLDDPYTLGVEVFFWENVPATPDEDTHPGELLYASGLLPPADPTDPHHVGWYNGGLAHFYVTLPEYHRFLQQGTPEDPVVYWVGVQVRHDVFGTEEFLWYHRQPAAQTGAPAAFSTNGADWLHWGEATNGNIATYSGTLPANWQPVDLAFQLYGSPRIPDYVIPNPSFETEWAGEMPAGGWLQGPPSSGMPDFWQYRRSGGMNGLGQVYDDRSPAPYWVSHGDYALYLFAWVWDSHYPGDFIEFYQTVDLTDVESIWFDAFVKQNDHESTAYFAVDGDRRWKRDLPVSWKYLNTSVDVRDLTGTHEIALGLEVTQEFGTVADGHTFFDNLRAVGVGDLDGDLDIDREDFNLLAGCLDGPYISPATGCEPADFETDGDVDLHDFGKLQCNFTGPLAPPS